jgi:hypothetical protein
MLLVIILQTTDPSSSQIAITVFMLMTPKMAAMHALRVALVAIMLLIAHDVRVTRTAMPLATATLVTQPLKGVATAISGVLSSGAIHA